MKRNSQENGADKAFTWVERSRGRGWVRKAAWTSGTGSLAFGLLRLTMTGFDFGWSAIATIGIGIGLLAIAALDRAKDWPRWLQKLLAECIPIVVAIGSLVLVSVYAQVAPDEATVDGKDVVAIMVAGTCLVTASAHLSVRAHRPANTAQAPIPKSQVAQIVLGAAGVMMGIAIALVAANAFIMSPRHSLDGAGPLIAVSITVEAASAALLASRMQAFSALMGCLAAMILAIGVAALMDHRWVLAMGSLGATLGAIALALFKRHEERRTRIISPALLFVFLILAVVSYVYHYKWIGIAAGIVGAAAAFYARTRPRNKVYDRDKKRPLPLWWQSLGVAGLAAGLVLAAVLSIGFASAGRPGAAIATSGDAMGLVIMLVVRLVATQRARRTARSAQPLNHNTSRSGASLGCAQAPVSRRSGPGDGQQRKPRNSSKTRS